MAPVPRRVVGVERESDDVVTLRVAGGPSEIVGSAPVRPAPGQFAMLYAFGVGEIPVSVSGVADVGDPEPVVAHTVRGVGAVSRALCGLMTGDQVGLRGPFGTGWPMDAVADRELLVVGGGIGLAPLRPVVIDALAAHHPPSRLSVAVGARRPDAVLFGSDLRAWRRSGVDVAVTVDLAPAGWLGDVGMVTDLLTRLLGDPARTTAMVCGPEVMMRVVARTLADAGVDDDAIHVSVERNMHCAIGHCGRCQLGGVLTCSRGPVLPWSSAAPLLAVPRL